MLHKFTETPDLSQLEEILHSIQPAPGERFYQRMENAPWRTGRALTEGANRMKRRPIISAIVVLVLALAAVLAISPAGKALANEILQFFTRSQSNTVMLPPDQVMPVVPTPTPEPPYDLSLLPAVQVNAQTATPPLAPTLLPPATGQPIQALADIRMAKSLVDFDLYEPASLPRDYRLTGIQFDSVQQAVILKYASPRAGSGEFFSVTQGKNLTPFSVGANAQVEKVSLGQAQAEFVRGSWFTPNGAAEATWQNDANISTLRWQAGEIGISVVFFTNETFSPAYLEKEEMLAVGRSLTRCTQDDPAAYSACKLSQAAAAAGFTPWQFPQPPAGMAFQSTDYQPGVTAIWYAQGASQIGLLQSKQDFTQLENNGWQSVPEEAVQTVTVGGQPGEYVKGSFIARPGESQAVWDPDSPAERLRWKNGEWWFQMLKWGDPALSPQELADLAAQVTPEPPSEVTATPHTSPGQKCTYDQAFDSIASVEEVLGRHLPAPALLPEGLAFSHARCDTQGGYAMFFYGKFAADKFHSEGAVLTIAIGSAHPAAPADSPYYPPEARQTAAVHGQPAQVTLGHLETGAIEAGKPDPTPVWKADPSSLAVAWSEQGQDISMRFYGGYNQGARLSVEDLLKIAESLQ
jgi:hypothetical protein